MQHQILFLVVLYINILLDGNLILLKTITVLLEILLALMVRFMELRDLLHVLLYEKVLLYGALPVLFLVVLADKEAIKILFIMLFVFRVAPTKVLESYLRKLRSQYDSAASDRKERNVNVLVFKAVFTNNRHRYGPKGTFKCLIIILFSRLSVLIIAREVDRQLNLLFVLLAPSYILAIGVLEVDLARRHHVLRDHLEEHIRVRYDFDNFLTLRLQNLLAILVGNQSRQLVVNSVTLFVKILHHLLESLALRNHKFISTIFFVSSDLVCIEDLLLYLLILVLGKGADTLSLLQGALMIIDLLLNLHI